MLQLSSPSRPDICSQQPTGHYADYGLTLAIYFRSSVSCTWHTRDNTNTSYILDTLCTLYSYVGLGYHTLLLAGGAPDHHLFHAPAGRSNERALPGNSEAFDGGAVQ